MIDMRKILSLLLAMMFSLAISSHARSFKYVYNDVTFKCNEDKGFITITSFDNDADIVVIPGSINGMTVKKVSCFINGNNYMASEIIIEEGVEEIAKFCFNEFRQLRKVTLPSTLTLVRSNAFRKNNDISFYGPDNFDTKLVSAYTSRPFNNDPKVDPLNDRKQQLLAQQKADDEKKRQELEEQKRQNEALTKALAEQKAEQKRLEKENRELEKQKLALAKKDKKQKKSGGLFSGLKGAFSAISGGNSENTDKEETTVYASTKEDKAGVGKVSEPDTPTPVAPKRKLSDVDINIPKAKKTKESTFCFIIANEEYDELPRVNYAENDGKTFRDYCVNALGVPQEQVFLYTNASYTSMMRALKKMESLAKATDGKSKFVFYYAGHGSPSEEDQSAFIVPSDGLVTVPSTCFSLSEIYKNFGNMPAESVVVLLDACFSGLNRDNSGLIAARAVARKPKKETVTGNVIVLSATSEDETAMGYDEKGHGMFTYHLLKKIQQTEGEVKFRDLFQSVSEGVRRDAIIKNDKNQTPSLSISTALKDKWENIYF